MRIPALALALMLLTPLAHAEQRAWKDIFPGFQPVSANRDATDADSARLRGVPAQRAADDEPTDAPTWVASAGDRTVLASYLDGISVYDAGGELIASTEAFDCVGSQSGVTGLAVGPVVAAGEFDVVMAYTCGGRESSYDMVGVYRVKGDKLVPALDVVVRDRGDAGSVKMLASGKVEWRAPGKKRKPDVMTFDAAAGKFK